ncbi:MAG: LysR family transcriptional regulator [Clostridiales bacterium]|jgi:DNA-binding transcriptional LysR family regulator|nr:LysR family transcriptional regulator [Clostridiales bacterium]
MEFRQLECFMHAARYNNFSKAAEALHMSQPALSSCIRLLEDELRVKLFDRKGKKVTLNEVGEYVLAHVNVIASEISNIRQICTEVATSEFNKVTILPAVTSWIVPFLLDEFALIHPEISLEVIIERHNAEINIKSKKADIIVMASVNELSNENIHTVYKEEIILAVPEGHSLAENDEIELIDLKPYSIISLTTERPLRTIEDYFFNLAGFTPKRSIECDSSALMRNLLEDGYGPALVPIRSWNRLNLAKSRLIHIKNPSCFRYVSVMRNNTNSLRDKAITETYNYVISLIENAGHNVDQ